MSDQHDEYSMTPPLSPMDMNSQEFGDDSEVVPFKKILLEELSPSLPICFACEGPVHPQDTEHLQADGFIKSGALERLVCGSDPNFQAFQTNLCELFGERFLTQLALQEKMEDLFFLARKVMSRLERLPGGHGASVAGEFMACRKEVRMFLEYVKIYVVRHLPIGSEWSVCVPLLQELKGLLLHIDRLHQLQGHILANICIKNGNASSNSGFHIFHGHLDIHWGILEILHLISSKLTAAPPGQEVHLYQLDEEHYAEDIFTQATQLLIWDLVLLAVDRHTKLSVHDYLKTSPFSCTCVKEMWLLIIHILDHRQQHLNKNSFWVSLHQVLQVILQGKGQETEPEEIVECKDAVGFCWWFLTHLAPLYKLGLRGESNDNKVTSNYFVVQSLLKQSLPKVGRKEEASLRSQLRCCLMLSEVWEPNIDTILLLWDHFYKRLNEQFQVPGIGIEGLATISKNPQSLVEQCKKRCIDPCTGFEQDTSFQLFLRLLSLHLGRPVKSGSMQEWRQLKGRVYSKFHARRMQELSEVGLSNFTSLFLTLAHITDLEDVGGKMCDLYDLLPTEGRDLNRRCVVWRGAFALMLLHEENNTDISVLADRLSRSFAAVARELCQHGLDTSRRHGLLKLLDLYIEGIQDVCEASENLALSESKLIGAGFGQVLPTCGEQELRSILSAVQTLLTRHRMCYKRNATNDVSLMSPQERKILQQHRALADSLWQSVYPFIKEHSCTQTPPPHLADVAAGFTLLAMDMSPGAGTGVREDFIRIFQHFAYGQNVNSSVSSRYLGHMLCNHVVMEKLSTEDNNYQRQLIQAWFRCSLQHNIDTEQMRELTRLMLKLPELQDLFTAAELEASENPQVVVVQFMKALGKGYANAQGLRDKINYRDKATTYFGDVTKSMSPALRTNSPHDREALKTVYHIGGHMVKYCAPFLYVKGKSDCLLPLILDRLVLPHIIFNPKKELEPAMLAAVREHLYLFVQGVGKLDRRDPYIQRRLKDLVCQYLPRFPLTSSGTGNVQAVHPLVTSLLSMARSQDDNVSNTRQFILEVLRDQYLTMRGSSPSEKATIAFTFITQVIQKTTQARETAKDSVVLLPTCLEYLMLCDVPGPRQQALVLLQLMLEASRKADDATLSGPLTTILQAFVSKHLKLYQHRVLKVLEKISVLHPQLVTAVMPALTCGIKESEFKRGVGVDQNLRQAYYSVLTNLGEIGQAEINQLKQEAAQS